MDELENILDQLKDSSDGMKLNLHTLDEVIPVETQMKYFQYSKYIQEDKNYLKLDRDYLIAQLFTPCIDIEDKKYYMCVLANLIDVFAYRALEIYRSSPLESELIDWSAMALIESKMLLDKEFLGEKQFFISTGLGGKNGLLRFFCIIASADRSDFTVLQKEILSRELYFYFQENSIEVEDLSVRNNYMKILFLSSITHDVKSVINDIIKECNILGDFVDVRFVLTNIKKIDDSDIEKMLKKESDGN